MAGAQHNINTYKMHAVFFMQMCFIETNIYIYIYKKACSIALDINIY